MTVDSGFAETSKASHEAQRTDPNRPAATTSLNSGLPTGPLRPATTPQS